MIWAVASLVPIAGSLFVALVLFAGWAALMIHWDRRALADATAAQRSRPAPVLLSVAVTEPAPVVAPAPEPVPEPARAPLVPVAHSAANAEAAAAALPDLDELLAPRSEPEPAPEPVVVRSGSFCTVVGATGVTAAGTEMVCLAIEGARPRWRRATRELAHTS